MFCPNCKYEYREGITVCADCGAPLVAELTTEAESLRGEEVDDTYIDLEVVFETTRYADLLLARQLLESSGIECFADMEFDFRAATGPNVLSVRAEDAEAALGILEQMKFSDPDDPLTKAEFEQ